MGLDPDLEQLCLRILQIHVCNTAKIADLFKHVVLTTDVVHSNMKKSKRLSRTCRIAVRSSNTWKAGRGTCEMLAGKPHTHVRISERSLQVKPPYVEE
jgi:hypothetical protein